MPGFVPETCIWLYSSPEISLSLFFFSFISSLLILFNRLNVHGLKFGLSPKKIDYSQWFLSFEKLFSKLKSCEIFASSKDDLNFFKRSLKTLAFETFYSFRPWSSVLEKQFIATLNILKKDSSIFILKADKGNAIVILNKTDYHSKMNSIISDSSKFKIVSDELFNVLIKKEDKINRLLMKLKKNNEISDDEYSHMHVSGK